jgi:large subunit ribosomal protein L11
MAPPKKITGYVKLQIEAGKATPAPPGRARARPGAGQHHGVLQAVQRAHAEQGDGRPHHSGRHYRLRRPQLQLHHQNAPAAVLLKKAAGIAKGSGTPNKEKIGKVTEKQVREIATQKMPDLNAASVETAIKSIKGTII